MEIQFPSYTNHISSSLEPHHISGSHHSGEFSQETSPQKVLPVSQEQGLWCKRTQFLAPGSFQHILYCFTSLGPHMNSLTGNVPRKALWILIPLWTDRVQVTRWSIINANLTLHIGHCSLQPRDPQIVEHRNAQHV